MTIPQSYCLKPAIGQLPLHKGAVHTLSDKRTPRETGAFSYSSENIICVQARRVRCWSIIL